MSYTIKVKRGAAANLAAATVLDGEILATTDTLELYLGAAGNVKNKLTGKAHASSHLTSGTDAIPVATASTPGLMSAADKVALTNASAAGEVWAKYQIQDDTAGNAPVAGCFVFATGQVYGKKEGTDGTYKTLRVKIPTGVKVRSMSAYFTGVEIGSTTKFGVILFDTGAGYIGMPNNTGVASIADFYAPQICAYNGTATMGDLLPGVVPKFTSNGTALNLNAIAVPHTTASAAMLITASF